jgi:hypothetical protein
MAADFGHAEALGVLVDIMKTEDNDQELRRASNLFRRFTPAKGEAPALISWYEANRERLEFDEQARKFLPKPSS